VSAHGPLVETMFSTSGRCGTLTGMSLYQLIIE